MLVCAEVGINHNGDMNLSHELIRQASINGADLVKFQLYEPKELFKDEPHLIEEAELCSISYDDFKRIIDWCHEESIEPFFSVFDDSRFEWTENEGIERYKIASRTMKKTPEFAKRIADTGKDIYVSTGMVDLKECKSILSGYENANFVYCVSKYPSEYSDYKQPQKYHGGEWMGLSDHTLGIENCLLAVARGATFIEKHFTLSKAMEGSDHKCSMTPDELYDLKKYSKLIGKLL